uniref:Uncharacterized protein n=1 Tax=Entomoneis paludosa TaxID=265537 RepID=A0A7S2YNZ1_9STRA|mmetsp:Transcript_40758/g.84819  ORF Transcript_40758/g.84819 Transcript_40758/m.84819 type:complete len:143 (+) Transcript_40758:473-901(+)|eukprot:CAMPEP_0172448860 /NCGR_PEP_ID=MMETSP1065-20121228/7770_1 /TAXON_ID=265537 /ORGANISM="Amphiprora paludosa, Strain CCMP125" /LENGTH=142 /DNA_ID=CAMNT_0013200449 /DNA_START=461 /DNA_END=889 /DNA_ORIENTATION=+
MTVEFEGLYVVVESFHHGKRVKLPENHHKCAEVTWKIVQLDESNFEFTVKVGNTLTSPVPVRDEPNDDKDETSPNYRLRRIRTGPCTSTLITLDAQLAGVEDFYRSSLDGELHVMEVKLNGQVWLQGPATKIVLKKKAQASS